VLSADQQAFLGRAAAAKPGTEAKGRARTNARLGYLLSVLGRRDEAEAAFRHALELNEALARAFPAVPKYRTDVAGSCVNLGILVRVQGRPGEALDWSARAVTFLEANLRLQPQDAISRLFLRNAQGVRADALGDLGRFAEAVAALDLALKFNDRPGEVAWFQQRRAAALDTAGLAQGYAWALLWGWPR
jgi:tetratricopeptide (TPR) repeat protein